MYLVWVSRFHLMCSSLHFLDIYIHIFTLTWSVFTFGKFQPLFLHSSGPLSLSSGDVRVVRVCARLMVPWVLQTLITFLQSFLSAPQSRSSSLSCFRFFVFFLPAQICLWIYWIFHLLLSFSVLEFLSGFFSGFLSLYWYYFTLFSFSTSSFSSLSTFRTVDLVWCVCHLDFSQTVSVICVFLWMGRISCSSCPLCLLLLLNSRHLNLIMW